MAKSTSSAKGKATAATACKKLAPKKAPPKKVPTKKGSRRQVATEESSDESADESDQTRQWKRKHTKKASNTDDDEVVEKDKEPEIEMEVLEIGDDDGGDLQDDSEVSFS